MSKRTMILLAALALVSLAALGYWRSRPAPTHISLELTGTTGLQVAGTVAVDDVVRDFRGVLPTNFTVKARSFGYLIRMTEPGGVLNGKLTISGRSPVSTGTTVAFGGLQGSYAHDEWGGERVSVTTVGGHRRDDGMSRFLKYQGALALPWIMVR